MFRPMPKSACLTCRGPPCRLKSKGARFARSDGEGRMTEFGRRDFLKAAVAGSVATTTPLVAEAQAPPPAPPAVTPATPGYAFLNLDEAAFVEALVDHMVPTDELTP